MHRNLVRQSALALATAVMAFGLTLLPSAPAQAASFSFADSNCPAFNLINNGGGSFTLQCSSISCSITAAPSSNQPPGSNITLTANCSGTDGGQTYAWSLVSGGDQTCPPSSGETSQAIVKNDSNPTTTSCTYKVAVTDGALGGTTVTQAVSWTTGPPPPPSGCTIGQQPAGTLPVGGGTVTLTASCTGGSGITWAWTGGFAQGQTTAAVTGNVSASQVFNVTATNGGGSSSAQTTVQVTGGGGGGIICAGYANTRVMDLSWSSTGKGVPIQGYSNQIGSFGANDAMIVRFTTPATTAPGNLGWIGTVEYQSGTATNYGKLSASSCDFAPASAGQSITEYFSVGSNTFGATQLLPNTTYYFNMHHDSGCTAGSCDVIVTLAKPQGI